MSTDFQSLIANIEYPKWNHDADQIRSIADDLVSRETAVYDYIASIASPTIENLLVPYVNHINDTTAIENQITFYKSVSDNKELRDASNEIINKLDKNSIEQSLRIDVYEKFNQLYNSVDLDSLDDETHRLLDKIMLDYKKNGLSLPNDAREEFKKLKLRISELATEFDKNLTEQNEYLLFSSEELNGVPQSIIDQFEKVDDKFKMTFKYPDLFPVLRYASNQGTRKQAYNGNQAKCPENAAILEEIIKLRFKMAKLLTFPTFSEYLLQDRLAKNQANVLHFLHDLQQKINPLANDELNFLIKFKNEDLVSKHLPTQDVLYQWDMAYYNNQLLEKTYKVDHNKIQEFFPLDLTINKMLKFYETLFDIKFIKIDNPKLNDEVWHKDVKKFAVFQNIKFGKKNPNDDPEFMGFIFFDLHPRQGKYGHAANFGLGPGFTNLKTNVRQTPFTVLVCNFTKATDDKPSLLKHSEVETFFHELGHGVHSILSKTKYAKFHGTRVPRDFVEAPSQMLEFWIWSKNELKELSSHYLTGDPINDELIDQLIKSKNVNNGLFTLRQLHFALFDMKVHTIEQEQEINDLDLNDTWNSMRKEISLLSTDDSMKIPGYASFAHIAHGYESGYYGYLYSNVFATDIFYSLFKHDPMNVENGLKYRDIILGRGNSKDMMDNLIELLGREPNSNNFLKELLGN